MPKGWASDIYTAEPSSLTREMYPIARKVRPIADNRVRIAFEDFRVCGRHHRERWRHHQSKDRPGVGLRVRRLLLKNSTRSRSGSPSCRRV